MRKKNLKIQMLAGNSLNSFFNASFKKTTTLVGMTIHITRVYLKIRLVFPALQLYTLWSDIRKKYLGFTPKSVHFCPFSNPASPKLLGI